MRCIWGHVCDDSFWERDAEVIYKGNEIGPKVKFYIHIKKNHRKPDNNSVRKGTKDKVASLVLNFFLSFLTLVRIALICTATRLY